MQEQGLFEVEADEFEGGTLVADPLYVPPPWRHRGGATPPRHVRVGGPAAAGEVPIHLHGPFSSRAKRVKDVVGVSIVTAALPTPSDRLASQVVEWFVAEYYRAGE